MIRRITNGGKKVIGKFPSIKCGKMVWWESQLERDFLYLIEIDPDVLSYEEQPLKIEYFSDGKVRKYTPDFLVIRTDRKQIVEVKDEKKAKKEEYVELFRKIGPICAQEGYEFIVATDREIRVQPRLKNVKFLFKYAKTPVMTAHQVLLYSIFGDREALPLREIGRGFVAKGFKASAVYALIFCGILSIDLSRPISPETEARLSLALLKGRERAA